MLDLSRRLKQQGLVRLKTGGAEYVPDTSGIYRVVAVPFSFSPSEGELRLQEYFRALERFRMDIRGVVSAEFVEGAASPTISTKISSRNAAHRSAPNTEELLSLASFFPALYIGKSLNLRKRFNEHRSGVNSHIQEWLKKHELAKQLVLFHWQSCQTSYLDDFESLLIQANHPIFNRQLR